MTAPEPLRFDPPTFDYAPTIVDPAAALLNATQRVRSLHRPEPILIAGLPEAVMVCPECWHGGAFEGPEDEYPCRTIRALNNTLKDDRDYE